MVVSPQDIYDFESISDTKTRVKWSSGVPRQVKGKGVVYAPMEEVRAALEKVMEKCSFKIINSKRWWVCGEITGFRVIPSGYGVRLEMSVLEMEEFLRSRFEGDYANLCLSKRPPPPTLLPGATWPKQEVIVRVIHEYR